MRIARGALLALALAACALLAHPARDGWRADWNARVDSARSGWEHPCATRAFIAWADAFLVGCRAPEADEGEDGAAVEVAVQERPDDCEPREDWVDERVEQCRAWTAWQLRNFHKHERSDAPEPSMRIE